MLGLVIRRALIILAVGVVLGVGTSLVLTRFLERFLWGVTRSDPAIFATIAAILIATGLIASVVPGSRAARLWRFKPATLDGTPVKFRKVVQISIRKTS